MSSHSETLYLGANVVRASLDEDGRFLVAKVSGPTPEAELVRQDEGGYVSGVLRMSQTRLLKRAGR